MSGQTVAAFVGKLLPLGLIAKKVHGLFLSLSPLTPEAEDYFREVKEMGLTTMVGQKLYDEVCEILRLPSENSLEKNIEGHEIVAPNILKTNTGTYKLLVLRKNDLGTPSAFVVYSRDGQQVTENDFLEKLKANVSELSGLDFWLPLDNAQKNTEHFFKREILKGLSVGNDWADYRLPAGPSVFIGRSEFVDKLSNHINDIDIPHVLQVKSRSGVGKSSLLSYLDNEFVKQGLLTELHDSRDVRTVYDIFYLVQRFTSSKKMATNFIEVDEQLGALQNALCRKKAVIFVDQFESTFANADIFDCYEYLANSITKINGNIYIIFARKNDQLTTYDDSKVSLSRINSISRSFTLPDFERDESILLLEKINESNNYILTKEILPYIIEFAQGFPWLLKRTIAHVLNLMQRGDSAKELIGAGLKLNDLFEEELEGLDEIEKDYLTRFCLKSHKCYALSVH